MNQKILAILGPTNTGKTHMAIERMMEHANGVIGFPLRLLAREVYDKVSSKVGKERVALITGEEKIIPPGADYYLCTVESIPLDINFEFVAIDEIQMCADPERGHIFTDRLIDIRGDKLTLFLGSNIIKNVIKQLVPNCEFIHRERLSKLSYSGYKKISRIQPRSALIAFSIDEVYALAEFVRRQRGGAAIVMGSLSPKTRNSQVKLYQSGDVDFLVATDAIGMGINMDIDHISFSSLKKFDGKEVRKLRNSEIGQISGRAGRFKNDGTFGITGNCEQLNDDQIEKLESHLFDDITNIYWRNNQLSFKTKSDLISSLNKKPNLDFLKRNKDLLDENILRNFIYNDDNFKIYDDHQFLEVLWECCQIPDFTKSSYNEHTEIIKKVFNFLVSNKNRIPNDWMKLQLKGLDNYEGNIDALANRISYVRTWSYVSNKRNWVENSDYWIARTKDIEDRLSDKLHNELSKSFIDKRISILSRNLKQDVKLETNINEKNEIIINGQLVGKLNGLKIELDYSKNNLQSDIKSMRKAAKSGASTELQERCKDIINNSDKLSLDPNCNILFENEKIAELKPGKDYLNPNIKIFADEALDLKFQNELIWFLKEWVDTKKNYYLSDLLKIRDPKVENRTIRGLCYQLFENNGVLKREKVSEEIKSLNQEDRKILRSFGVKIGRYHIYQPRMIRPNAIKIKSILWTCFYESKNKEYPAFGLNFLTNFKNKDKKYLLICGFESFKNVIIRIDILERLFVTIMNNKKKDIFELNSSVLNLLGCNKENFKILMGELNYKLIIKDNIEQFRYFPKKVTAKKDKKKPENPFHILKSLEL